MVVIHVFASSFPARMFLLHQLLSLLRKKLRERATLFEEPSKIPENRRKKFCNPRVLL